MYAFSHIRIHKEIDTAENLDRLNPYRNVLVQAMATTKLCYRTSACAVIPMPKDRIVNC